MFEIDQSYLAYELAYRTERLTGRRGGERGHHVPRGRGAGVRRLAARAATSPAEA